MSGPPARPDATTARPSLARRTAVSALALASGLGGIVVALLPGAFPGAAALALGMIAFLLLPLLLNVPRGVPLPTEGGVTILTGKSTLEWLDRWARMWGTAAWMSLFLPAGIAIYGFLIGTACAAIAALGLWRRATSQGEDAPAITLEVETLTIRGAGGSHVLRYADLREVRAEGATLWFTTAKERLSVIVEGREPAHMAARIRDRIERAKSASAARAESAEGPSPTALRRAPGMSALEWLTRLDAMAALQKTPDGYRRGGVDEDELWRTLADDGADLDARAAAARVLTRGAADDVRVRVDAVVNELPEHARVRVASALAPELEEAAAAVEAAEIAELTRGIV